MADGAAVEQKIRSADGTGIHVRAFTPFGRPRAVVVLEGVLRRRLHADEAEQRPETVICVLGEREEHRRDERRHHEREDDGGDDTGRRL